MQVKMLNVLILFCMLPFLSAQDTLDDEEACNTAGTIEADDRLFTLGQGDNCDNTIDPGWYKFEFANGSPAHIPTVCIQNHFGGTRLPMRLELSGKALPDVNNTMLAHVCTSYNILGNWDCCVLRQETYVKNCGDFYVYYLTPVDRCPVAFVTQDDQNPTGEYTAKTNDRVDTTNTSTASAAVNASTEESQTDETSSSSQTLPTPTQTMASPAPAPRNAGVCGNAGAPYLCFEDRYCANTTNPDETSGPVKILCSDDSGCGVLCDGVPQCPDDSDELDALCAGGPTCSESQIACPDGSGCSTRCDGVVDCQDGRDELLCNEDVDSQTSEDPSTSLADGTTQESSITSAFTPSNDSLIDSEEATSTPTYDSTTPSTDESDPTSSGPISKDGSETVESVSESSTVPTSNTPSSDANLITSTLQESVQSTSDGMKGNQTITDLESITAVTSVSSDIIQAGDSQNVTTMSYSQSDQNVTNDEFVMNITESNALVSTNATDEEDSMQETTELTVTEAQNNDTISTSVYTVLLSGASVTIPSSTQQSTTHQDTTSSSNVSKGSTVQSIDVQYTPLNDVQSTQQEQTSIITSTSLSSLTTEMPITSTLSDSSPTLKSVEAATLQPVTHYSPAAQPTTLSESTRPSTQPYSDELTSSTSERISSGVDIASTQQVSNGSADVTQPLSRESSSTPSPTSVISSLTASLKPTTQSIASTSSSRGPSLPLTTPSPPSPPPPMSSSLSPLPSSSSSSRESSSLSPTTVSQLSSHSFQTSTSASNDTNATMIVDDDEDVFNIIGHNPGLFVFLIATGVVLFGVSIFGIVGVCYFRRLRTWRPEMSFQDAYAETEKSMPPELKEKQGVGSPIPDVDILRGEEVDSPSKASTLVCGPTPDRLNTLDETSRSDLLDDTSGSNGFYSTPLKPPALYADMGTGQGNDGLYGDTLPDGEGVVPINEWDQIGTRNMFPWIEAAEDTKL